MDRKEKVEKMFQTILGREMSSFSYCLCSSTMWAPLWLAFNYCKPFHTFIVPWSCINYNFTIIEPYPPFNWISKKFTVKRPLMLRLLNQGLRLSYVADFFVGPYLWGDLSMYLAALIRRHLKWLPQAGLHNAYMSSACGTLPILGNLLI